jgi:hypothetical protein
LKAAGSRQRNRKGIDVVAKGQAKLVDANQRMVFSNQLK